MIAGRTHLSVRDKSIITSLQSASVPVDNGIRRSVHVNLSRFQHAAIEIKDTVISVYVVVTKLNSIGG